MLLDAVGTVDFPIDADADSILHLLTCSSCAECMGMHEYMQENCLRPRQLIMKTSSMLPSCMHSLDVDIVGVGEYPMTGTQAAEKEEPGSRADKLHRGRNVVLAFTMQASTSITFITQLDQI